MIYLLGKDKDVIMDCILKLITKDNINFFSENIVPILTLLGAVLAAAAAIYKYFNEKNRDFYMSVLANVYEPLFEEIIKMEYSRKHLIKSVKSTTEKVEIDGNMVGKERFNVKYLPFIYFNNTKTSTTWRMGKAPETKTETKQIYNFDDTLKQLLEKVDLNYAPKDLVALLKIYFYMDNLKGLENFEFVKEQKQIQKKIRKNILVGYKKYRKKLGLKDVTTGRFCYILGGWVFFR